MSPDPSPSKDPHFRCSSESLELEEPLAGTASTVRTWLLVEQPGPWGEHALRQSRLPPRLGRRLRELDHELGVRVLLLRRHGRTDPVGRHVFAAHSGVERQWLVHALMADPRDLLDVDLQPLARGDPPGLGRPDDQPLFLVCTNGRRDPCCAERGRPLARALAAVEPDRTWESSHIGGDRFAGNIVCLPRGLYFGRVEPSGAEAVAGRYRAGAIDLDHYRGRSAYGFALQAAEARLRRHHGLAGLDDLALVAQDDRGDELVARFQGPGGRMLEARVRTLRAEPPRRLTCHQGFEVRPPAHDVATTRPSIRGTGPGPP